MTGFSTTDGGRTSFRSIPSSAYNAHISDDWLGTPSSKIESNDFVSNAPSNGPSDARALALGLEMAFPFNRQALPANFVFASLCSENKMPPDLNPMIGMPRFLTTERSDFVKEWIVSKKQKVLYEIVLKLQRVSFKIPQHLSAFAKLFCEPRCFMGLWHKLPWYWWYLYLHSLNPYYFCCSLYSKCSHTPVFSRKYLDNPVHLFCHWRE